MLADARAEIASPVAHGRGLEHGQHHERLADPQSPVAHGRGLELFGVAQSHPLRLSPVAHGRGLEPHSHRYSEPRSPSPVAHGRGLELQLGILGGEPARRPSRTGVDWNTFAEPEGPAPGRRPSRTGVDWNVLSGQGFGELRASPVAHGRGLELASPRPTPQPGPARRPSRTGVDWNWPAVPNRPASGVARRARAWIGTPVRRATNHRPSVARRARAWIGTLGSSKPSPAIAVARRARAWIGTATFPACPAHAPGRPSRTGVDWNHLPCSVSMPTRCRPSRTGVDWNGAKPVAMQLRMRSPVAHGRGLELARGRLVGREIHVARRARAWIGTLRRLAQLSAALSRPSRTGVDWNKANANAAAVNANVARRARAWIGTSEDAVERSKDI